MRSASTILLSRARIFRTSISGSTSVVAGVREVRAVAPHAAAVIVRPPDDLDRPAAFDLIRLADQQRDAIRLARLRPEARILKVRRRVSVKLDPRIPPRSDLNPAVGGFIRPRRQTVSTAFAASPNANRSFHHENAHAESYSFVSNGNRQPFAQFGAEGARRETGDGMSNGRAARPAPPHDTISFVFISVPFTSFVTPHSIQTPPSPPVA